MTFKEEKLSDAIEEMKPLFEIHRQEITFYKDILLNPDYEAYAKIEKAGLTRVYTARDDSNKLIGYAVFFVKGNLHYKQSLVATEDIIYVAQEYRRGTIGTRLIKFCDDELRKLGVQVVSHHVKFDHDWSKILLRMGYDRQEMNLTKRLDR
jgi:GNAT superfamily N-acetyltransferase